MNMILKVIIALILIASGIWTLRSWKKKYEEDPKSAAATDIFDSILFGPDFIIGILLIVIGAGLLIYFVLMQLGLA